MPIVKSDAYGHGNAWVVEKLRKSQIWGFGVAYGSEAIDLLPKVGGRPIIVLSAWQESELPRLIRHRVRIVAGSLEALPLIAAAARRVGQRALIHLKIDTGTTRIGILPQQVPDALYAIRTTPAVALEGIFTHLADSEGRSLAFAQHQLRVFQQAIAQLSLPLRHIACTAASLRVPLDGSNLIRLGLGLYGLWPSRPTHRAAPELRLRPVMTWKTRLLQIKRIPAGTTVGYDRTFRARRPTTIGILPVGYADGYDRGASNRSRVVIDGHPVPVVGRVSMNLTMIELGNRRPRLNHPVTLLGPGTSADDLAHDWSTINYEVVTRIATTIPRVEVA